MNERNPIVEDYLEIITAIEDDFAIQMSVIREWYFAISFTILRNYGADKVPAEWEFEPSEYDLANIDTIEDPIEVRIQSADLDTLLEAGEQVIEDGRLLKEENGPEEEYEEGYDPEHFARVLVDVGYTKEGAEAAAYGSSNSVMATERIIVAEGR